MSTTPTPHNDTETFIPGWDEQPAEPAPLTPADWQAQDAQTPRQQRELLFPIDAQDEPSPFVLLTRELFDSLTKGAQ